MGNNIKVVIPITGLFIFILCCFYYTHIRYEVQHVLNISSMPMSSIRWNSTQHISLTERNNQSAPQLPKMVVILTYMRSGSSLTGDILQQSTGAFYVYEPFRALNSRNSSTYTVTYVNGTKRRPPFSRKREAVDALYNWLTCNISRLPTIGLLDNFLNRGIKTRAVRLCLPNVYNKTKSREKAMKICSKQLQNICDESPIRIVKTIRLALSDIKHFLEMLPTLKIVHLVRDPRATLSSQARLGMCKKGDWYGCTNNFCKRLENDVIELERLRVKYPDRILPVMYEDIAKYPLKTSRKMYDLIGEEFTSKAETYIYNITMAGNKNNCAICTTRSNSTEHVDAWKTKMRPEFLKVVNERCNYILKRFNFDVFPEQTSWK